MDEVARRARVGRPSLYKHFPGRDALIGAVVQTELAKFLAEVQSVVERYDDPDARLVHGFAHAYRLLSHHPAVSRILRLNPESFLPYVITHDSYALNLGITFRRIIPVEGRPLRGHTHTICRARRARLPHPDPHPSTEFGLEKPDGPENYARNFLIPVLNHLRAIRLETV